ncbi:MAG: hypothetical protein WBD22_15245 [Pyrinomonadaceae bacterium]
MEIGDIIDSNIRGAASVIIDRGAEKRYFANLVRNGRARTRDAGESIVQGINEAFSGFVRGFTEGAIRGASGIRRVFRTNPRSKYRNDIAAGITDIGRGLFKALIRSVFDFFTVAVSSAVSVIETLIFIEAPARGITISETDVLRGVFCDSLDCTRIRIKEGRLGLRRFLAPHTVGNTIYIPGDQLVGDNELLVHEAAHVWQYQNGGTAYLSGSLWCQFSAWTAGRGRGGAYDFECGIENGTPWRRLNPEQQAHLIEIIFARGSFALPTAGFFYNGTDHTVYAGQAVRRLHAGKGAP